MRKYETHFPVINFQLRPLSLEVLKKAIADLRDSSAGCDGLTARNLKCLPDPILLHILEFYKMVERRGSFPDAVAAYYYSHTEELSCRTGRSATNLCCHFHLQTLGNHQSKGFECLARKLGSYDSARVSGWQTLHRSCLDYCSWHRVCKIESNGAVWVQS